MDPLNFLFPVSCVECESTDFYSRRLGVCKPCWKKSQLQETVSVSDSSGLIANSHFKSPLFCRCCEMPLAEQGDCRYCSTRNVFFERLVSLQEKEEFKRNWMNHLKFHRARSLGGLFSLGFVSKLGSDFSKRKFDLLTIIPSLPDPRVRDYSPMEILVQRISKKLSLPYLPLLEKVSSERQAKLDRKKRFLHARNAFQIRKKFAKNLKGRILLLDDVFTTGATVNEASRLLLENGAESVTVLVQLRSIDVTS